MSLGIPRLEPVLVREPRLNLKNDKRYAIVEGGTDQSWHIFAATTGTSITNVEFNADPPSPQVVLDREALMTYPLRFTFTKNAPAAVPPKLLNIGSTDALRAFPIASSMANLSASLNNESISIPASQVIHPLSRYYMKDANRNNVLSMTASHLDSYIDYDQGVGQANNALGKYGDSSYAQGRGALRYSVVDTDGLTATVDVTVTEPLFLPPFLFGSQRKKGFIGLQTLKVQITMIGNLARRLWSHAPVAGVAYDAVSVAFSAAPSLHLNFITPRLTDPNAFKLSQVYPYYKLFPQFSVASNVAGNADGEIRTNNFLLSSIPRRFYFCVREAEVDLLGNSADQKTDTYARINQISFNFGNRTNQLAAADSYDLYRISKRNGLDMSWVEWDQKVGSVLCLDAASDLIMNEEEAAGQMGRFQVSAVVKFTNLSAAAKNFEVVMIPVEEGILSLEHNRTITSLGVFNARDVLSAKKQVSYAEAEKGSEPSGMGMAMNGGRALLGYVKKGRSAAKPSAMKKKKAGFLMSGGKGGKGLSRAALRKRLMALK